MDCLQNELDLSRWASDTPCHLCPGGKTVADNWIDFRAATSWKKKPASTPLPVGVASHACANVLVFFVYSKLKHNAVAFAG